MLTHPAWRLWVGVQEPERLSRSSDQPNHRHFLAPQAPHFFTKHGLHFLAAQAPHFLAAQAPHFFAAQAPHFLALHAPAAALQRVPQPALAQPIRAAEVTTAAARVRERLEDNELMEQSF